MTPGLVLKGQCTDTVTYIKLLHQHLYINDYKLTTAELIFLQSLDSASSKDVHRAGRVTCWRSWFQHRTQCSTWQWLCWRRRSSSSGRRAWHRLRSSQSTQSGASQTCSSPSSQLHHSTTTDTDCDEHTVHWTAANKDAQTVLNNCNSLSALRWLIICRLTNYQHLRAGVLRRWGASSGWRMEEALREVTLKGCAE